MSTSNAFGPPAIELDALRIWVHGYQYPAATDAWDANWLRVTARCAALGASVEVTGAILDTVSFLRFQRELVALYKRLQGLATLESHEPELKVEVRALAAKGQMEVRVEITPEHLNQAHRFILGVDQTYLPAVIRGCEQLLVQYPVRDAAASGA
jgi:hypothetical protein